MLRPSVFCLHLAQLCSMFRLDQELDKEATRETTTSQENSVTKAMERNWVILWSSAIYRPFFQCFPWKLCVHSKVNQTLILVFNNHLSKAETFKTILIITSASINRVPYFVLNRPFTQKFKKYGWLEQAQVWLHLHEQLHPAIIRCSDSKDGLVMSRQTPTRMWGAQGLDKYTSREPQALQ